MNKPTTPAAEADELLSVRLSRVLPAPRERVFEAWTSADMLSRWWGPRDFRGISATAEPRPGGEFAVEMQGPDGAVHLMAGLYTEVVPPALVCMEIRHRQLPGAADRPEGYIPTRVRVELREHREGTELLLSHVGFLDGAIASRFDDGWAGSLEKLETFLVSQER